ncbi:FAD-dependent monooxygenase [Candidatus Micrarchaeota archaeon]|nr:FAD-dependent monooxygenase [Candidatus Micrarchaeota archaeon]MBU1930315.1 FAD-dependent monooxygenase [Candidatus Micrarchaeota archaeon]
MTLECDILVIGGGPAGLAAARAAALKGAKVICIEKKEQIGKPVQCAEGIGTNFLHLLPFKIPPLLLRWPVSGYAFHLGDLSVVLKGKQFSGFSIDRWRVEQWLSREVIKGGGKVLSGSTLSHLNVKKNKISASFTRMGEKKLIKSKKLICADGAHSLSADLLGLYSSKRGSLGPIYTWEVHGARINQCNLEHLFLGSFAPTGYGYLFPKSKTVANIGVGAIHPRKPMEKYFDEFLQVPLVKKQVKNAKFITEKSKDAAFGKLIDKWTLDNVLFAGDIATHNYKPFVEGFIPAMIAGHVAGNFAADNISFLEEDYRAAIYASLPLLSESDDLGRLMFKIFKKKQKIQELLLFGLSSELFDRQYVTACLGLSSARLERRLRERLLELSKLGRVKALV